MKKIVISFLALVAISNAALAERSSDLRESDTYFGKYAEPSPFRRLDPADGIEDVDGLTANPFDTDEDTREMRRLQEKNNSSAN